MKKHLRILTLGIGLFACSKTFAQDVSMNILSLSSGIVQLDDTISVLVTICNEDPSPITAPANIVSPILSVGANVSIVGATNTDGSTLTNFTVMSISSGTANSIMLLMTSPLENFECYSFHVRVVGKVVSPPSLVSGTIGFQGPQTPGNTPLNDNSTSAIGVIPPLVPDLTPTLDINALTFVNAGDTKDFVVNLYEINGVSTDGPVSFRITKLSAFNITYPTTSGTSNVLGGTVNQNSNWTFTENTNFITATANAGITIPANGFATIGFQISRKPGVAGGNSQNLSPTIVAGSGGETNNTNNQVVTTLMAN